ncbi:MAG: PIN domain-containing protein [Microcystis viridis Mv_BB_P_19951000_S69]|uniref:PIN domain-containing protein n=1 Tax=Microcystis viridis Mv_BB_P_19951000_S68D TaxID=2486270 RepID=A0A552I0S1_MICVR|nr:MAG: PIN domain-containing protein [Microcystis viridis Mv_BB_P_19951000_S68]TRU73447.1 MAG: PIN domain-containing protein [Microcystis viridis Mv_BB_P_19951000_S69]TRU76978.1 MAG: PIN domain-containing protein [Microcystis viridis Mv_BB_P_19951000_S68D]TRU85518.1 MAG: PIN domain-containing protein [Microcystis viridis Mv_BB_P_19951000_S69D]
MKIYLDTSALHRIFDDRSQVRIALEALAVQSILLLIQKRTVELIISDALAYEISRNPYPENKMTAFSILRLANSYQVLTTETLNRGQQLETNDNIGKLDALHLACAESQQVDFFITCDDRLIKRYKGIMRICNPVEFILLMTESGDKS